MRTHPGLEGVEPAQDRVGIRTVGMEWHEVEVAIRLCRDQNVQIAFDRPLGEAAKQDRRARIMCLDYLVSRLQDRDVAVDRRLILPLVASARVVDVPLVM